MKKILLFLFLVFSYNLFAACPPGSGPKVTYTASSLYPNGNPNFKQVYYPYAPWYGYFYLVTDVYECAKTFPDNTRRECRFDNKGVLYCVDPNVPFPSSFDNNGNFQVLPNPDPLADPSGRCRSLYQKDGQAYSCNPDTNEATIIPNSDGVTIDPEDGRDIPNCKSGYVWSSMGSGGTRTDATPTHTVYSCIPSSTTGTGGGDTGGATNPNVGTVTNPDGTTTTTLPDGTTHTYYPSSQTTVTRYPSGQEVTTYHNNSNGGTDGGSSGSDSGSGSTTGGTSGTGSTGGTTGTDSGTGSTGGTTGTTDGGSTGGTSSSGGVGSSTTTGGTPSTGGTTGTNTGTGTSGGTTGTNTGTGTSGGTTGTNTGTGTSGGTTTTTPPTTETGAGNCNDSNLTLQEKMLCELNKSNDLTNSKLTTSNTHLNSIDKSLGSINSNLQDENGKSYLENISDFVTTFTAPVSEDTKASYSSQINSKVTSALNDSFTKYSNVLGFGSDYGNRPENITLTLFNQQYTLIDFSLLDPFVSIIRSLFLTLAYLYGFMNLLKGDK